MEIEGDTSGHTTGRMTGPSGSIQIAGRLSGRRNWSVDQKLRIIGEAFSHRSSVAQVAGHHEISTGQLYTWRKQLLDGELCGQRRAIPQFAEVEVGQVELAAGLMPQRAALIRPSAGVDARPVPADAVRGTVD